ncbi:hypothetical protein JCM6882_006717 [Rhodosporidiobolus microsporus]
MDGPWDAPSRALLRIVANLAVLLLEGSQGKALARVAEDLGDVVEEARGTLPAEVSRLVESAQSTLSSPSSVPYAACTAALSSVTHAAELLANSASPPYVPPLSRLPAELVSRIVEFCQLDDPRQRQKANLLLASTSRTLYRAVRPVLVREMHLFTARQLERAAASIRSRERNPDAVRVFTADLKIADIELQPDGSWAGRRLLPLIAALDHLEVLHLRLRRRQGELLYLPEGLEALAPLGGSDEWFDTLHKPTVRDLHLPSIRCAYNESSLQLVFGPPPALKALRLGEAEEPPDSDSEDADHWYLKETLRPDPPGLPRPVPQTQLKVLAVPWRRIKPVDLLRILRPAGPASASPCTLEHLEVLLDLEGDIDQRVREVAEILFILAPTIQHLSLRLVAEEPLHDDPDQRRLTDAILAGLAQCTKLLRLEMGGPSLWTDWPIDICNLHPPNLHEIVLLPCTYNGELLDYSERRPRTVRSAVVCIPGLDWTPPEGFHWRSELEHLRGPLQVAEENGMEVKLEVRAAEAKWWEEHGGELL